MARKKKYLEASNVPPEDAYRAAQKAVVDRDRWPWTVREMDDGQYLVVRRYQRKGQGAICPTLTDAQIIATFLNSDLVRSGKGQRKSGPRPATAAPHAEDEVTPA